MVLHTYSTPALDVIAAAQRLALAWRIGARGSISEHVRSLCDAVAALGDGPLVVPCAQPAVVPALDASCPVHDSPGLLGAAAGLIAYRRYFRRAHRP